jgi:hypothetical protein
MRGKNDEQDYNTCKRVEAHFFGFDGYEHEKSYLFGSK